MKKNDIQNNKPYILIIVTAMCLPLIAGGCQFGNGFSVGPRDGLFGIPIDFSKREKPPKRSVDDLHESMLAENATGDTTIQRGNNRRAEHSPGWLDAPDAPSAGDWYAGTTQPISATHATDTPQSNMALAVAPAQYEYAVSQPQTGGVMQASYNASAENDAGRGDARGIASAAMARETVPDRTKNTNNVVVAPIPLEQDLWVANLELERYRDGKTDQRPESPWRWRHRGIEEILLLPPDQQPDWQALLRHENTLVRANTLITLARAGDQRTGNALVALANDVSRSRPMRCAAVEALASLPSTSPDTLLQLADTYCDGTDADGNRKGGVAELAVETLYAVAAKMPVSNTPCFLRPLESRDAKVRLAAVCVWRDNAPNDAGAFPSPQRGGATLPDRIVQYCNDPNTVMQEAALTAVVRWRHPQAMICLDLGLRSPKATVRCAAIRGLAVLRTEESVAMLVTLTNDQSSAIRAEVVAALGQVGLQDRVYQMSDDTGWEVRKAVAKELVKSDNPHTQAIAKKYLHDVSKEVQVATLESLRFWHPESCAALLFEAMGGNVLEARYLSTEMLSRYWEPARDYQPNGRTEVRKEQYRQLAGRFQHDMQTGTLQANIARVLNGQAKQPEQSLQRLSPNVQQASLDPVQNFAAPENVMPTQADCDRVRMLLAQLQQGGSPQQYQNALAQLAGTGPIIVPVLEQIVIDEGRPLHEAVSRQVLPGIDPLFEIAARIENNDPGMRRAAVAELVGETKFAEFSPLLYRQLAAHSLRENDEIVLQRLWDFADRQSGKLSQLDVEWQGTRTQDRAALQRQQRLAQSLAQFRKSLTAGSLAHASPELHRRACSHIREYGQADDIPALLAEINHPASSVSRAALQGLAKIGTVECAVKVRPLLTHSQPLVAVDAALTLDRWGDPAGTNALERLAASGDRTTKLAVVQGIKKNLDRKYVPLLVRLLDDSGAIRQEALDALPLAAGRDVVPPQEMAYYSTQERVALWKQWDDSGQLY